MKEQGILGSFSRHYWSHLYRLDLVVWLVIDDIRDLTTRCDEILERHGLYFDPAHPSCDDVEVKVVASEDIDATKVMLWPVYDLVAVRTEFQLLGEFLVHDGMENGFRERVQKLIDFYLVNCPFTPPTHLLPWRQLLVTTDIKVIHRPCIMSDVHSFYVA